MHDLVGAFLRLDRMYRLYIKSAFPLRSPALAAEREAILKGKSGAGPVAAGILSQPPLLETVPVYPSSGLNLDAATKELPTGYEGLASLGQKLMPPNRDLWAH